MIWVKRCMWYRERLQTSVEWRYIRVCVDDHAAAGQKADRVSEAKHSATGYAQRCFLRPVHMNESKAPKIAYLRAHDGEERFHNSAPTGRIAIHHVVADRDCGR